MPKFDQPVAQEAAATTGQEGRPGVEAREEKEEHETEASGAEERVSVLSEMEADHLRAEREQAIEGAKKLLAEHGYAIDAETSPYKSFNKPFNERFLIQKCRDAQGRDVVVKVGEPGDPGSMKSLQEESALLSLLESIEPETSDDEQVRVSFLHQTEFLDGGNTVGLATEFADEDGEFRDGLTAKERADILVRSIKWLQGIKLPGNLTDASVPRKQRSVSLRNAAEHLWRVRYEAKEREESGFLSEAEARHIVKLFEENQELIDSFPLVLSHGDLHGGNVRVTRDADGKVRVKLIDLEAVEIQNGLYDYATDSIYAELGVRAAQIPEAAHLMKFMENNWMDPSNESMKLKMIEAVIHENSGRETDALKVFSLMRIARALRMLPRTARGQQTEIEKITYKVIYPIIQAELRSLEAK